MRGRLAYFSDGAVEPGELHQRAVGEHALRRGHGIDDLADFLVERGRGHVDEAPEEDFSLTLFIPSPLEGEGRVGGALRRTSRPTPLPATLTRCRPPPQGGRGLCRE